MSPGELVLEDIANSIDCKGIALVARDGNTLCSNVDHGVSIDTFAIMSATMIGAAATASKEVGQTTLKKVVITSNEGVVAMYPAGRRNLVVLVFDELPEDLDDKIKEHLENLGEF